MKKVTVTLREDTAHWVRTRAAENERSVSRWLAELLEGMRRDEEEYDLAMKRYLAREPRKLQWVDGRRATREEIYDRPVLRWDRKPAGAGVRRSGTHRRESTAHENRR